MLKTEFYYKQLSNGRFTVGCDTSSGKQTFAAGHTTYIQALLANDKIWKRSSAKAIRNLISIEAKNDSLYVGGPIDIMKVTDKRTRWISRKKVCPIRE